MNKKFSTLLAGAALVAAVSANAQNLADVKDGVALDINKILRISRYRSNKRSTCQKSRKLFVHNK